MWWMFPDVPYDFYIEPSRLIGSLILGGVVFLAFVIWTFVYNLRKKQ